MKIFTTFLCLILGFWFAGFAQQEIKMFEKEITIPTYMVEEPDKSPVFYTGRAYQGAQGKVYPYPFNGNLTDEKKDVAYKGLFIENEFLEICVLPELGGRLYYMKDKTNGYDVIYKNNVVKPSLIGMLGAWISGGVEWNVPHHHRASTFMPMDYELVDNKDGSKTIWVGELEIRHQVRWMVGLTMFPDKAMVQVDIKYINTTPMAHPFLIWANTAVHTNENYQVIYPPKGEFATFHRKIDFTRWPISNESYRGSKFENEDISWWKNTPRGGSFFSWEDQGQFVAGIDHGKNAGLCVVGNKNIMIGKKLWTWGTSKRADMWEDMLTDADGPYIEIMTGAYSNNQPDYSWCHPYFTKEATMFFMPLRGLSHVKESTLEAAINFEHKGEGKGLIELHSYADFQEVTVALKKKSEVVWSTKTIADPAQPGKWLVDLPSGNEFYDFSVEVIDSEGNQLVNYQPEPKPKNPLPEEVKPAKSPKDIAAIDEVVFTGLRMEQIFNPKVSPLSYYQEALDRDPNNAFANLRAGSWYLKKGMFEKAETHLQKTADRWTTDYTRAKDCESFYLLGLAQLELGKNDLAYENFYKASWDYTWFGASHLQLAQIESGKGNYKLALAHIEKSLSVGINNIRAREIQLSLLRKIGDKGKRKERIASLKNLDPLNLYISAENVFENPANGTAFTDKMRGEIQNYLDIAVKLGHLGMYDDGITILNAASKHPNSLISQNPLIYYYIGDYQKYLGNETMSNNAYEKAANLKIDYCFPFRFETEKILETAISQNPKDAHAWYLLGNLLYDNQPQKAITKWEKAIELDSKIAMAYRNLAFAANHTQKAPQKAKEHILMAIKNDQTEPDFYAELDKYSFKMGDSPESRLQKLNEAGKVIDRKDNSLGARVSLEILCGQENKALEVLQEHHFRKVEGVGNIHDTWVDGWLVKGKKQMDQKKPKSALISFKKSLEYPRNLDIGSNSREGQSHYFIGLALEKSGKKKLAKIHFEKALTSQFDTGDLYFKGMAYAKLKNEEKALETFNELNKKGDEYIKRIDETDFFSIFGSQKSKKVRLAEAYALKGLSAWGLGKKDEAEEYFAKTLASDPANFTAKIRLFD